MPKHEQYIVPKYEQLCTGATKQTRITGFVRVVVSPKNSPWTVEGCGGRQLTLTEVAERLCAEVICGRPLGTAKATCFIIEISKKNRNKTERD